LLYSNYALKSRQFFDFFQPFLLLLTEQEGASKTPLRKHGVVFCSKKKKTLEAKVSKARGEKEKTCTWRAAGQVKGRGKRASATGGAMRWRSPAVLRLQLWLLAVSASLAALGVLAADLSKGELSCLRCV
jgi:hypothetical protein